MILVFYSTDNSADSCSFFFFSLSSAFFNLLYLHVISCDLLSYEHEGVCAAIHGCDWVCMGVLQCAWVGVGVHWCAKICTDVCLSMRTYAWVCAGVFGYVRVCVCVWDEFL